MGTLTHAEPRLEEIINVHSTNGILHNHDKLERLLKGLDIENYAHSVRVEHLAEQLAAVNGVAPDYVEALRIAGRYHDVGKTEIALEILQKPGKLTSQEFDVVKGHAERGYNLLKEWIPREIAEIVLAHHYPDYPSAERFRELTQKDVGLILPLAKYLIAADKVDAMLYPRSYQPEFSPNMIRSKLRANLKWMPGNETLIDQALGISVQQKYQKHPISNTHPSF